MTANIGIGTVTATEKLEVVGNIKASGMIVVNSSGKLLAQTISTSNTFAEIQTTGNSTPSGGTLFGPRIGYNDRNGARINVNGTDDTEKLIFLERVLFMTN